jgi:hypothetical protein
MRLILSILLLALVSFSSQAQTSSPLTFETETIELGTIKKGDLIEQAFTFTNTSTESVFIDLVSTCECTEADWPEDEIKAGDSGEISFVFDTNKKEKEEAIDVDVILRNTDKDGNPYFHYLSYTFKFDQ